MLYYDYKYKNQTNTFVLQCTNIDKLEDNKMNFLSYSFVLMKVIE